MSANKAIVSQLWGAYKHTPVKVKIMDLYLIYVLLTGIAQFVYCMLVGTFPFNSFLSGFISTVGCFVLTVGLRMQSDTEGKLKWNESILPERAFADWLCANLILHVACFCFMG